MPPYRPFSPVDGDHLAVSDGIGRPDRGDDRWDAVLPRDDRGMRERSARVGDDASDHGEDYRPRRARPWADDDVARFEDVEVRLRVDDACGAGDASRRGRSQPHRRPTLTGGVSTSFWGPNGVERYAWVGGDPEYRRYPVEEWGVPLHRGRALFERAL